MTHLIDIEKVRQIKGLSDVDDINIPLALACDSATAYLEAVLDTSFTRVVGQTDVFMTSTHYRDYFHNKLVLRLSNGLLDVGTTTLKAAYSYEGVSLANDVTNSGLIVNIERGLLTILGGTMEEILAQQSAGIIYILATYTKGFVTEQYSGGVKYTNVPAWLEEAATLLTQEYMSCEDGEINFTPKTKNILNNLLSNKARFSHQAVRAIQ